MILCSHLAVVLEMKSDPVFHRYISESIIKDQISLLRSEYDRVTALHTDDRNCITNLQVVAFGFPNSLVYKYFIKGFLHYVFFVSLSSGK